MLILVTGGARSGKSSFAEKYAAHLGKAGYYIATAEITDEEMKDRVELHQEQRNDAEFTWTTREEPYELAEQLQKLNEGPNSIVMIDCLTIWLSNWVLRYEGEDSDKVIEKITVLIESLKSFQGNLLLVTNEVGSSIVPEYVLGRRFRDFAGLMNQRIAAVSDQVFMVTAGIPIELKSKEFKFPSN